MATQASDNTETKEVVSAEPDAKAVKNKGFVQYVGQATRRVLTEDDWKSLDMSGDTVEWNFSNAFKVPTDKFTQKQLGYLFEVDGRFKAVD